MVDVKLDVGDSPSLKAGFKKKSGIGICRVLVYLLMIGGVTILALDAAELISLGIVEGVMGLKVMKVEELTNLKASHEKQLADMEEQLTRLSAENDGLRSQVIQVTDERNSLIVAGDDKQNQVNAVSGERDTLAGERDALKKQLEDLTPQIADLKTKVEKATSEKTGEA